MTTTAPPLPLRSLLPALCDAGVTFRRQGDQIALKNAESLPADVLDSVREHKAALLSICDLRDQAAELHSRIIYLRCEERTARADRPTLLAYVRRRIDALGVRCDVRDSDGCPTGWIDSDPFADDALTALQAEFEELRGGAYPVQLPEGCHLLPEANFDPHELGRTYSGKVL